MDQIEIYTHTIANTKVQIEKRKVKKKLNASASPLSFCIALD